MAKDARIKPSPEYESRRGTWEFLLRSYESGIRYLDGNYLFKHQRESPKSFGMRKERATPPGYARAVINTYASLIGRGDATRNTSNEQFSAFLTDDCDGRGTPFEAFALAQVFPVAQAIGFTWCLVDMPKKTQGIITRADELEKRLVPYCVTFSPLDVINWMFDGFGNLLFVTVREVGAMDPETGKRRYKHTFKVWTRDEWLLYDDKGKLIEGDTHGLGMVPFALAYNERSVVDPNTGVSAITNIAYLNRLVFNVSSLLDEFLYKQCFNFLAVPAELVPEEGEQALGTSNAIPIQQGSMVPAYVTPPVAPAEFLMKTMEDAVARIYHEAGLVDKSAQQTAQAQSGISRAFEFHNTNTLLAKKAKNMERFEQDVATLWFKWMGAEYDFSVDYPDNFDVRDATAELDELTRVLQMRVQSPTWKRQAAWRVFQRTMRDVDQDTADLVKQEIDVSTFGGGNGNGTGPVTSLASRFEGNT